MGGGLIMLVLLGILMNYTGYTGGLNINYTGFTGGLNINYTGFTGGLNINYTGFMGGLNIILVLRVPLILYWFYVWP